MKINNINFFNIDTNNVVIENCVSTNLNNVIKELYKRFIIPFYIPILILIALLLIIYSKENVNYLKYRILVFFMGFITIIFSETTLKFIQNTFIGNLSPITGALITADAASYLYTGVQAQYKLGFLNVTPSFTPGLYFEGDGKDLGHLIEFKSELQFSLDLSKRSELGFSYNHLSNASLGDKNPGANSYMFNFLKNF